MIKLAIMGAGRMGTLVRSTAEAMKDNEGNPLFEIVAQIGFDLNVNAFPAADVLVDFSNVVTLDAVCKYVERHNCALVSGTTGYDETQLARLKELGQKVPVMYSGNYSLGIAALRHLTKFAAKELAGFDVEICETHHNQKVDAPSGTANMLLEDVLAGEAEAGRGEYAPVYGRQGMVGKREPKEVGMHSLRGGTVAGVHTVSFFGADEEISLTHRATSRQIFVNGALAAVQKLIEKPAGFYDFETVMFGEN